MNLGAQKVNQWRKRQCPKVTQVMLGERFGLSQIQWSRILRGERRPPLDVAVRLQRAGVCEAGDWYAAALAEAPVADASDSAAKAVATG